jgi:threonine dehydrogenase-like Zn-dependent dehydrogenase
VPTCQPGRILGHEGVGIVDKVGPAVTAFKPGDRVLISCVSACGKCVYCRKQMYSHCTTGGWILGNAIDGTQAEFVRTPYADTSLYPIPEGADIVAKASAIMHAPDSTIQTSQGILRFNPAETCSNYLFPVGRGRARNSYRPYP